MTMRNRNLSVHGNVRNDKQYLIESIMNKIRPIVINAVNEKHTSKNIDAYKFLNKGSWNYECLEGEFDFFDENERYTINLYALTNRMIEEILISSTLPINKILKFIRGGAWNYECLDGALTIYDFENADNKVEVILDLYKLTPMTLSTILA